MAKKPGKPFLKWAGGKNWFIKHLGAVVGDLDFDTYYEPFLGGGSVFFHLAPENAKLSDTNKELIDAYEGLRDDVEGVIGLLESWPVSEENYYRIRSASYDDKTSLAARFIYLNRTSFNGIYRVNRKGVYNVPYGHNDGYKFDYDRLRASSGALQNAMISVSDYESALKGIEQRSLVFLDPPYTVAHNNNGFIEYNKKLFSLDDQHRLRKCINSINEVGAYFILTNAAHQTIKEIFDGCGTRLELPRYSTLGGKHARRQSISEFVFTNIPGTGQEER